MSGVSVLLQCDECRQQQPVMNLLCLLLSAAVCRQVAGQERDTCQVGYCTVVHRTELGTEQVSQPAGWEGGADSSGVRTATRLGPVWVSHRTGLQYPVLG